MPADWQLTPRVVVADARYGTGTPLRLILEERGLSCVAALTGRSPTLRRPSRTNRPMAGSRRPHCPLPHPAAVPAPPRHRSTGLPLHRSHLT
ncbi:transposase [Streptomyces sp. NBC_01142]|uniref:transposase n=1 Tax=Streptomyces sp. NBC_01142 TaxID=2975865 RepID=UPI00338F102A